MYANKNTPFDVEGYLNSLPDDATSIELTNMNLTYLPDISRFTNLRLLFCGNNQITALPILPKMLECLYCYGNHITYLPDLPENLQDLFCEGNDLTELPPLPESLQKLHCYCNKITSLPTLPKQLRNLYCGSNRLTSLPTLPDNLVNLFCECNKITRLPNLPNTLYNLTCYYNNLVCLPPLPESLGVLCCYHNNLTYLPPLPESLQGIDLDQNPISQIILTTHVSTNTIKSHIRVLNRFRHMFYCIKYKSKFRQWLWLKIREPKMIKKYHPVYLESYLGEKFSDEEKDLDIDVLDIVLSVW